MYRLEYFTLPVFKQPICYGLWNSADNLIHFVEKIVGHH
uniref:Uncharacterized protein n=1 Tax=Picea sitchensis TaxID=3332 RepID=D5A856_PICSI|nr:unknown [Picea sitchensis]